MRGKQEAKGEKVYLTNIAIKWFFKQNKQQILVTSYQLRQNNNTDFII